MPINRSELMLFPSHKSIGGDSYLLLTFSVTHLSSLLHEKLTLAYLGFLLFYPMLSFSFKIHSTGHLLKKGLLTALIINSIVLKPYCYNWEAVSFILDKVRHQKRGRADNPGKVGLIQDSESLGGLWMSEELDDTKAHMNTVQTITVFFPNH